MYKRVIVFWFILLSLDIQGEIIQGVEESDFNALVSLYNSTNGEDWANNNNWLTTSPVSNWYGVVVANNRVVGLYLQSNNLTGQLPENIGDLNQLELFRVSGNQVSDAIPSSFNNLVNLEEADISNNLLSGDLPEDFSGLLSLKKLFLHNNYLSGQIPASIGSISNLRELNLSNNELSGPIPIELSLPTALKRIELQFNKLSGNIPEGIIKLPLLEHLNLSNNLLGGVLRESFFSSNSLTFLDISKNRFEGRFPISVLNLLNLEELNISSNRFNRFPDISTLPNIYQVDISRNRLSFNSIIENLAVPFINYSPQEIIKEGELFLNPQEPVQISVNTNGGQEGGGAIGNVFQWYKDDQVIPDQTNPSITLDPNINASYYLVVSNPGVAGLVLRTGVFTVKAEESFFNAEFLELVPESSINSQAVNQIIGLLNLGDINGDNVEDLGVLFASEVHIYPGGNSNNTPLRYKFSAGKRAVSFVAGKFNSDPLSDLTVSVRNNATGGNEIFTFFGSNTFDFSNVLTTSYSGSNPFGSSEASDGISIRNLGDLNGDTFDELGVGAGTSTNLIIWKGGSAFGSIQESFTLPEFVGNQGLRLFSLGDINDDEKDDFAVSLMGTNRVFIYYGRTSLEFTSPDLILNLNGTDADLGQNLFGYQVVAANVNDDSNFDLIITAADARSGSDPSAASNGLKSTFIFYGPFTDLGIDVSFRNPAPPFELDQAFVTRFFGDLQLIGDYDEDGVDEILVTEEMGNTAVIYGLDNLMESSLPEIVLNVSGERKIGVVDKVLSIQNNNAIGDFNNNGSIEIVLPSRNPLDGNEIFFFEYEEPCELLLWYADVDNDGFGDPENTTMSCDQPPGFVDNADDCDDLDGGNRNGIIFYPDLDGDGWGNEEGKVLACVRPDGFLTIAGDCDDDDPDVYPGAPGLPDGKDNNCDGIIDMLGQIITFPSIGNQLDDKSVISLEATSTSGLPIQYTVEGPALLEGDQLELTGPGVITLTASQEGNEGYMVAEPVSIKFCVNPTPIITLRGEGTLDISLESNYDQGNQWYFGGQVIDGENEPTYAIESIGSYLLGVQIDGCSGISEPVDIIISYFEEVNSSMKIYPNPVVDYISINVNAPVSLDHSYSIIDQTGKVLYSGNKMIQDGSMQLDVSQLSPGTYLLLLNSGEKILSKKFVKE